MDSIIISIADFSKTPGSRFKKEGQFSGEVFRKTILEPNFAKAIKENKKMIVNLDGTLGYGPSFLEESFGGLARKYNAQKITDLIEFVSQEEPYLLEDISNYIKHAND